MIAFHGSPDIKAKFLARVEAHRAADEIVQGQYWENGRGCAVGCSIHGSDHGRYETELGIPKSIARLEDAIFEGLPLTDAKDFPGRFLAAISVGADLSNVTGRFLHWLLTGPEIDLAGKADPAGKAAIATAADLWRRRLKGDEPAESEWDAASAAARAAASAAASAAARAAASAAAWDAARDAARAAASAAARDAARAAARDAAWDAARAAASAAAWDAARAAAWKVMADHLIALLSEAPVAEPVPA